MQLKDFVAGADGMALSDYLKNTPTHEQRDMCARIAEYITLDQWVDMDEPFRSYVGYELTGEAGNSFGLKREFHIRIMEKGPYLLQGFDRRNRRNITYFEPGQVVTLEASLARVVYSNFGPYTSQQSQRNKVKEVSKDDFLVYQMRQLQGDFSKPLNEQTAGEDKPLNEPTAGEDKPNRRRSRK